MREAGAADGRAARAEILGLKGTLAASAVERQYARQPGVWERYGEAGRRKAVADGEYHVAFLAEAVSADAPVLFLDYVRWARQLFEGLGFPADALQVAIQCTMDALADLATPAAFAVARPVLEQALAQLAAGGDDLPSFIMEGNPLASEARAWLDRLLEGRRTDAEGLISALVERGASLSDVYLKVFQPGLRDLGRLWQLSRITVAQEHYCTAATQLMMARLSGRLFGTRAGSSGKRLVAACVQGELHEVGIRMIADLFEMQGWDTDYVGASTPPASAARMAAGRRADVLAVSATMTYHLEELRSVVAAARQASPRLKIIVGGRLVNLAPDLWRSVGADGSAMDAEGALDLATRLAG